MPLINSAFGRLFLRTPRTLACFHGRNALRLRCLEPRLEPSRHCSVSCKQRERGAKPRFLSITKGQPIVQSGSQKRGMSLLRQTRLPGPAFTIKFDRDTWECFTGEALKEYLLNERHVDVTSLPVEQFSQWLAEFVIRQRKSCSIFRQREQIASLLCEPTHAEQIEKLKVGKQTVDSTFSGSTVLATYCHLWQNILEHGACRPWQYIRTWCK